MIDIDHLYAVNLKDWHKPYGGQITLNCEDVDIIIKALEKACMKVSHLTYNFEDEEDNENPGCNLAYGQYKIKAKQIREEIIKEVSKK